MYLDALLVASRVSDVTTLFFFCLFWLGLDMISLEYGGALLRIAVLEVGVAVLLLAVLKVRGALLRLAMLEVGCALLLLAYKRS